MAKVGNQLGAWVQTVVLSRLPVFTKIVPAITVPGAAVAVGAAGTAEERPSSPMIVAAVVADPWRRLTAAHGRAEAVRVAEQVMAALVRQGGPALVSVRRGDLEWLVYLDPHAGDDESGEGELRWLLDGDQDGPHLDVTIGIAIADELPADKAELEACADAALSAALLGGHNMQFATAETLPALRAQVELMDRLTRSEVTDFPLVYQPIVALAGHAVAGYEALVRWQTDDGLLSPDKFLPAAEESDLIVPIGRHVVTEALAMLAGEVSARHRDGFVAVNLSVQQLWDRNLVADIRDAIAAVGVEASRLWIEIRENDVVRVGSEEAAVIEGLHELGCTICVDDLGSGFSALRYLRDLPIDVVKVDKTLIDDLMTDPAAHAVVQAIANVAKTNDIRLVAEGVETAECLPILGELGFDYLQGYLFGRPQRTIDDVTR
ncbi:MAG: EAL domain-containing protein [Gordonia sp. (in: high G+C Gram-positive bacteria)]